MNHYDSSCMIDNFVSYRQYRHGVSNTDGFYRDTELEGTLRNLGLDRRLRFKNNSSTSSNRDENSSNRTSSIPSEVVSVDFDTQFFRYWLIARVDGTVTLYDSEHALQVCRAHETQEPLSYPLGYVPTRDERRQERARRLNPPLLEPVTELKLTYPDSTGATSVSASSSQQKLFNCCYYLGKESNGIISSSKDGSIAVWDITQFHQSPIKLFDISCCNAVVCSLAVDGGYTNYTDVVSRARSRHRHHGLIACCSLNPAAALRLLDLRVGSFVAYLQRKANKITTSSSEIASDCSYPSGVLCAAWNPIQPYSLVSGGYDGNIRCWDIRKADGSCILTFDSTKRDGFLSENLKDQAEDTGPSRLSRLVSVLSSNRKMRLAKGSLELEEKEVVPSTKTNSKETILTPVQPIPSPFLSNGVSRPLLASASGVSSFYQGTGFTTEEALWEYIRSDGSTKIKSQKKNGRDKPLLIKTNQKSNVFKSQRIAPTIVKQRTQNTKNDNRNVAYNNYIWDINCPNNRKTRGEVHENVFHKSSFVATVPAHKMPVTGLTFVQGGAFVVSNTLGSPNLHKAFAAHEHIKLWNANTGHLCSLTFHVPITISRAPTLYEMLQLTSHNEISLNNSATSTPRRQVSPYARFSPSLYKTKCEVLCTSTGQEYLCCGMGAGLGIYSLPFGELISYSQGNHLQQILGVLSNKYGNFSGIGGLISVDAEGNVIPWGRKYEHNASESDDDDLMDET